MKIEIGKRYVMRYGGITGVISQGERPIVGQEWTDGCFTWHKGGGYFRDGGNDQWDLVSEYIPQNKPLPFGLKAGERYETVKPDGTVGPVVTLAPSVNGAGWRRYAEFYVEPEARIYVLNSGACVDMLPGEEVYRIVRPHTPPSPIERLEKALTTLRHFDDRKLVNEAFADAQQAIADLKAGVK
jgi:hypothetical protein